MINLPNLDDQKYTDIVEAAKRRIPVIFPEWTDMNEHDPGITLIELFAWLKEMQQYTLNRIPDRTREAMLRLVGTELRRPTPATAEVLFSSGAPLELPVGSSAVSADGTEFTLTEPFRSQPYSIGRILMRSGDEYVDVTGISSERGTVFYPFGSGLECTGRYLYISLSAPSEEIRLDIMTEDRCPVPRNPFSGADGTPRDIVWEYSAPSGFRPCKVVSDGTHGLSFSGRLILRTGEDFAHSSADSPEGGVWLRASVVYSGCEDMPLLSGIYTNMLALVQKQRESGFADTFLRDGAAEVCDVLAATGERMVMLRDEHGWREIPDPEVTVSGSCVRIDLPEYSGMADGAPDVRVIFCRRQFSGKIAMSSDGLPCQEFPFDPEGTLLTDELRIMVRDRADSDSPRWNEYSYIDDLALAGADDRVFTYDAERRCILFGDNENGEVPPVGYDNILIVSCALTRGAAGNISAGSLQAISAADSTCAVEQPVSADGGTDRESLEAAVRRFRYSLTDNNRAVTAEDHRRIALRTPGLRVADVRAIPFFDPEDPFAPPEKRRNLITLAVLPYSRGRFPVPDERFLAAVKRHMEKYRLLTLELRTCAPVYVRINITAEIICGTSEVAAVRKNAEERLRRAFSIYGENGRTRFGVPVLESELIESLCGNDGVLAVKYIRISADRPDCRKTPSGIQIPPHGIAYCGGVELITAER